MDPFLEPFSFKPTKQHFVTKEIKLTIRELFHKIVSKMSTKTFYQVFNKEYTKRLHFFPGQNKHNYIITAHVLKSVYC